MNKQQKVKLAKYNTPAYKKLVAMQLDKLITGRYVLPALPKGNDKGFAEVAAMKAVAVAAVALIALFGSGCAGTGHMGDYAQFSGTPAGLKALGDTLVGMQKTAKESPDAANEYMALRVKQDEQETRRATAPGFFTGLFAQQPAN